MTVETYPRTFMLFFLAASSTDPNRSMLSAIVQLTFFFVNDSDAAPKTAKIGMDYREIFLFIRFRSYQLLSLQQPALTRILSSLA